MLKSRELTLFTSLKHFIFHMSFTCTGISFLFRLSTLLDVSRSLEYLAYLGYMYEHDSQLSAIHGKSTAVNKRTLIIYIY